MKKRLYYVTEETKITRKKAWVDIDMNFSQMYSCFNNIAPKIKSATSFKLLFWLLANKTTDSNGVICNVDSFNEFNQHLKQTCEACEITYRTYSSCLSELVEARAFDRTSKGTYYANPHMFWKDDKEKREQFLISKDKDRDYRFFNPIEEAKIVNDDKK